MPPQNPNSIFRHCPFRTPPSQVSKNTFSGPCCAEVSVFGAPPQKANNTFWHCRLQTPPSQVSKSTFCGVWCAVVLVFGAPPQNSNNTFWCHWGSFGPGPPFIRLWQGCSSVSAPQKKIQNARFFKKLRPPPAALRGPLATPKSAIVPRRSLAAIQMASNVAANPLQPHAVP